MSVEFIRESKIVHLTGNTVEGFACASVARKMLEVERTVFVKKGEEGEALMSLPFSRPILMTDVELSPSLFDIVEKLFEKRLLIARGKQRQPWIIPTQDGGESICETLYRACEVRYPMIEEFVSIMDEYVSKRGRWRIAKVLEGYLSRRMEGVDEKTEQVFKLRMVDYVWRFIGSHPVERSEDIIAACEDGLKEAAKNIFGDIDEADLTQLDAVSLISMLYRKDSMSRSRNVVKRIRDVEELRRSGAV